MTEELVKRLRSTYTRFYKHEATTFGARVSTVSVGTYYHNPDGPEAADAIEALTAEIERLTYDSIHTCHDNCPRLPCVQRREIEGLRAEIRRLMSELQAHKDALAQAAPKP